MLTKSIIDKAENREIGLAVTTRSIIIRRYQPIRDGKERKLSKTAKDFEAD